MLKRLSSEELWSRVRGLEGQTVYTLKVRRPNTIEEVTEDRIIIRGRKSTPTRKEVETVYSTVWDAGVFRVHEGNWRGPASFVYSVTPAIVLAAVPEQVQAIADDVPVGIEHRPGAPLV